MSTDDPMIDAVFPASCRFVSRWYDYVDAISSSLLLLLLLLLFLLLFILLLYL